MPTYCYEKPDGSIVERIMTIAEMEKFDKNPVADGETLKRRVDVEMGGHSTVNDLWRTPLHSEGSACHTDDIPSTRPMQRRKVCPQTMTGLAGQSLLAVGIVPNT